MNIGGIKDCYGCGVCAAACSKNIIEIKLNKYGFYEPYITDENACTNCGLCMQVCSYADERLARPSSVLKSYAGWSTDNLLRARSSSGGVAMAIARYLLSEGYHVCGVRYNVKEERAEHFIANNENDFLESLGSKYIQSFTKEAFSSFNRKDKYLVFGTPCQIDSMRRYVRKFRIEDNFVLVDIFCHGVPSLNIWRKYLEYSREIIGEINFVAWRNKLRGWHHSQAMLMGEVNPTDDIKTWDDGFQKLQDSKKPFINIVSQEDLFYRQFNSEKSYGNQCYEKCKFKYDQSSADIRLGDMWGNTYGSNEEGVSCIAVYSERGDRILHQSSLFLKELPFETIAEEQLRKRLKKDKYYYKMRSLYSNPDITMQELEAGINEYYEAVRRKIKLKIFLGRIIHVKRSVKGIIRRIKERI